MDQDLPPVPTLTSPAAPSETQPQELITAANLPNHLPIYVPHGKPMLVFHYDPAIDNTNKVPNQFVIHVHVVMSFLIALGGIFKYIPENREPDSHKMLVFIEEQKLAMTIAAGLPGCNEELQRQPYLFSCHLLNHYNLIPPVSIFDPSIMNLANVTIQETYAPAPQGGTRGPK
jgi:hypothetical protein